MFKGLLYDSLIVQKGGGEFSSEGGVREQPKQQESRDCQQKEVVIQFPAKCATPKSQVFKTSKEKCRNTKMVTQKSKF